MCTILEMFGVKIHTPSLADPEKVPQQLAPRDLGAIIYDKKKERNVFVVANMVRESRKAEWEEGRLKDILNKAGFEDKDIIFTPKEFNGKELNWEGGNLIVDGDKMVIGVNERTGKAAVELFEDKFGNKDGQVGYEIKGIGIKDGEGLHLDTVFKPICKDVEGKHQTGKTVALFYKDGVEKSDADWIEDNFKVEEVNKEEQQAGGCNVFSLSPNFLMIQGNKDLSKLRNRLWKNYGIYSFGIPWVHAGRTGTGGPNCAILPLIRG